MMENILLAVLPIAGGWALFVERRLSRIETLAEKLDKFIDLMMEERFGTASVQGRSHPGGPLDHGRLEPR